MAAARHAINWKKGQINGGSFSEGLLAAVPQVKQERPAFAGLSLLTFVPQTQCSPKVYPIDPPKRNTRDEVYSTLLFTR